MHSCPVQALRDGSELAYFRRGTLESPQGEITMQAALMIPCYIDMFYPHVGIATVELLEKLGVDVVYPKDQTCCGQPMANSGCYEEAQATEEHCAKVFGSFDYVVTPSGRAKERPCTSSWSITEDRRVSG
jgi:Fe-S oxidoreductase